MESASTPTKPKRSRAVKAEVSAPLSHRERMAAVDARAKETQERVLEEMTALGYGPNPRTSIHWLGRRTKGQPYSRMMIANVIPGIYGMRGTIVVRHPTRRRSLKKLAATDAIMQIFMPSLPPEFAAAMLGVY